LCISFLPIEIPVSKEIILLSLQTPTLQTL
jgi:hypothetical protein